MESTQAYRPAALGSTLALTIAIMYAVCTVLWLIWQEPALDFLNALFHGLDFRKLAASASGVGVWTFVLPLVVLAAWGFVAGTVFGAIANRLRIRR